MINIICEFFGTSGYASHSRQLANALNELDEVKITSNLPPNWVRDVSDKELEMIKRKEDFQTNLIITNPLFWRINAYAKTNIVYLIWEGDKIPQWMVKECLNPRINKILIASNHTKRAVENTTQDEEILNKLVLTPHGVNSEIFKPLDLNKGESNI